MADSQRKTALLYDNPLCGISTYKDTLNLATGVCARQIKKLVLTGNESGWVMSGTGYFYNLTLSDNPKEMSAVVSTHFTATTTPGTVEIGCIRFGGTAQSPTQPLIFNYDKGAIGLTAFKQWLAAQYSAGTPVTVWYVLETPTTETITVPSGLSGTEEGYLNQSGTPTPTNPIYPTANNVEIWLHSLRKLTTATEAVENPLYSDGTAITAYTLKGNAVQNGTPTPSNPVDVNGVGVRTENLFDGVIEQGTWNAQVSPIVKASNNARCRVSDFVSIEENKEYTVSLDNAINGIQCIIVYVDSTYSRISETTWQNLPYTFTTPTNTVFIEAIFRKSNNSNIIPTECGNLMLNVGSTAKPFEPYGYKIPISSGGVTTNIYLGSTQTVRPIKSKVIPSDYSPITATAITNGTRFELTGILGVNALPNQGLCTHAVYSTGWNTLNAFSISRTNGHIHMARNDISTVEEFREWLADQSANGTPVTVWYVLATPQTAAVNEPLMKIGTYSDTLSNAVSIPTTEGANSITVDTTVQPSEFTATWTGWRNAEVKEKSENLWNESYTGIMQDVITYLPLNVGDGDYTLSSTATREGEAAVLFLLAGNVSTGAATVNNGVWNSQSRTVTAVNGYVTIGYRKYPTANPENANTMLNTGSTALPYEPYWK